MRAKFGYENYRDILKAKDLNPELQKKWEDRQNRIRQWGELQRKNQLDLDDIFDELNHEQQDYIESILSHSGEIRGLYNDKYWRNRGWNGTMDSINEIEERYGIEPPDFDIFETESGINILELIVKEI